MSTLHAPTATPTLRSILAAALMTFGGLAACTDEPEVDMHITRFADASPADRAVALVAPIQGILYARNTIAMAAFDAVSGCPAIVREPREQRVTFTAPAEGCRGAATGITYRGVAVAVNAPEGDAGSPIPASPMSLRFTDFRLETSQERGSLHGNVLQTVAEPTGAYAVQFHPLVMGLDGGTVTLPHLVLECAVVPGGTRCGNTTGARGQLADGSEFGVVVDVWDGDEGPGGFVELRGKDTLRLDFANRDATFCAPYHIDGVEAGTICEI